ncbi:MAG: hypothetical protein ABW069_21425 [Duganella sp.]
MKKFLFVDLDDTLFSTLGKCASQTGLHPAAYYADQSVCSYTTARQRAFLALMDPATTLIPATARHLDAFSRVDLPFSSYKILNFGGLVLGPDNLPDAAWMAQMREAMTAALPGLNQAVDVINAYAAQQGLAARARVVEDGGLPFYALIKDADKQAERLAPIETEALAPWLAGSGAGAGCGFYVHRNGNNLAVLPKALDKAVAVEYVARLLRAQYGEILTLGMGDSRSDARFMAACDYAIIPTGTQLSALTLGAL